LIIVAAFLNKESEYDLDFFAVNFKALSCVFLDFVAAVETVDFLDFAEVGSFFVLGCSAFVFLFFCAGVFVSFPFEAVTAADGFLLFLVFLFSLS